MASTPPDRHADQMEREVNRLLAQLAHSGAEPIGDHRPSGGVAAPPAAPRIRSSGPRPAVSARDRWALVALWGRVLLGAALGALMTQWPYAHDCGWSLLRYFGAVGTVLLAGAWIALASWRLRSGVTHLLGLILFFWGLVLAAEQVLPRVGYAPDSKDWLCAPSLLP
jgi:hypothetical protein